MVEFNRKLKKAHVRLVDRDSGTLECEVCGTQWHIYWSATGERLAEDYWRCPKGCNDPKRGKNPKL